MPDGAIAAMVTYRASRGSHACSRSPKASRPVPAAEMVRRSADFVNHGTILVAAGKDSDDLEGCGVREGSRRTTTLKIIRKGVAGEPAAAGVAHDTHCPGGGVTGEAAAELRRCRRPHPVAVGGVGVHRAGDAGDRPAARITAASSTTVSPACGETTLAPTNRPRAPWHRGGPGRRRCRPAAAAPPP